MILVVLPAILLFGEGHAGELLEALSSIGHTLNIRCCGLRQPDTSLVLPAGLRQQVAVRVLEPSPWPALGEASKIRGLKQHQCSIHLPQIGSSARRHQCHLDPRVRVHRSKIDFLQELQRPTWPAKSALTVSHHRHVRFRTAHAPHGSQLRDCLGKVTIHVRRYPRRLPHDAHPAGSPLGRRDELPSQCDVPIHQGGVSRCEQSSDNLRETLRQGAKFILNRWVE